MLPPLVVKVTVGAVPGTPGTDLERCNQGLTVAATAAAAGAPVSLWLTGDAVWLAVPGHPSAATLPHATPVDDLLAAVLASGTVTVCGQCAARRDLDDSDLVAGVTIAGAASFVEQVLAPEARSLVY